MKKTVLLSLGAVIGLGLAMYSGTEADAATNSLYRLYNPNSGEHFFTESTTERDGLVTAGWTYEPGAGWQTPTEGRIVYRLYNPNVSDHFYTTSESEYDSLEEAGWTQEGKAYFSSTDTSNPVHRSYNPNAAAGAHMFTVSSEEHLGLINVGWINEETNIYAAPTVDKTDLNAKLTEARALVAADYDETTFAALQEAITAAAAVADNADATEAQVTAQVKALTDAIAALVPNLTELNAAIEAANNYDEADITAASYADLAEAITAAEDFVAEAAGKTPAQAKTALDGLNAAIEGLVVSTTALNEVIEEAGSVVTEGYSEESVAAFTAALATANGITEESTIAEVTAARTGLRNAIDGLVVDMTELSLAIEAASAYDQLDITEASYEAMGIALETATGYMNEPTGVTPAQVTEAIAALEAATEGLVKDTTALEAQLEAYDELGTITAANYSKFSYNALTVAFNTANGIAEDATIADVTAARIALRDAMEN